MFDFKAYLRFAALFLAAFAIILFSGAACKPPKEQAGPPEKITIAYAATTSAVLVHIAFAKGYFAQEGLDATPQIHAFGKAAFDAVIEGKADLATVADTPVMFAIMGGRKITILAVIQTSNRSLALVTRQDRGLQRPRISRGKQSA